MNKVIIISAIALAIISFVAFGYAQAGGGKGGSWNFKADPSCNFIPPAQISYSYSITDNILIYLAKITLGSCETNTDLRYIPGVTTTDQNVINQIIAGDLDAWAAEQGIVTGKMPPIISGSGKGSTTKS